MVLPLSSGMRTAADPIPKLKEQVAAELVRRISTWTTTELCFRLRIDQPRISDLRRGKPERFSLERLIRLLNEMNCRVELNITEDRGWIRRSERRSP